MNQLNVIRVTGIENCGDRGDAGVRPGAAGRRVGIVTASGGACDIVCNAASAQGIEVPDFAPETVAAMEPRVRPFATAQTRWT